MIFDYLMMFTDEQTTFSSQSSGVVGRVLDFAGAGQGKGKSARIAFAFKEAITSGGPVSFILETADNDSFTNSVEIPLSMPPLKTSDMVAGATFGAPLPVVGMERYCRLKINATSAVTLTGMLSGFVFDSNEK